jgi:hypothetical protein
MVALIVLFQEFVWVSMSHAKQHAVVPNSAIDVVCHGHFYMSGDFVSDVASPTSPS